MEHALPSAATLVSRDPVQVTCQGDGSPPLPVLARVTRVFSGETPAAVWAQLRDALRVDGVPGGLPADELVLLRAGLGADEAWTELRVLGPDGPDSAY